MSSLPEWLQTLGLEQYTALFEDNEVDFETLQVLTDNDLKELGLPFGPRKRLLNSLRDAKQLVPPVETGERRQITVLFCDMVGFTELANRVDPEILQGIIRSYEDTCAVCIVRFGGYVFQRLGDGIVAFFGFPLAHEGEAERAIRAGLQIIDVLSRLEVPELGRIKVRIGIATGIVVVASGERGAVGETMNLASRLQGIAQPGTIVVSERVRRLAGGAFDYQDIGEQDLKGISRPTRCYGVLGLGGAASRFDAATRAGITPLIGREHEIQVLMECWDRARTGSGQAVLLSGEPGIGKSRILSALREHLEPRGIQLLRFQCSPFYTNSAYYPISAWFERELDELAKYEPAASKLDRLAQMMTGRFGQDSQDVRFIAAMLSIPFEESYGVLAMTPRLIKAKTSRVLMEMMKAAARAQPTLLLFEDLHWGDPTTLDLLGTLIGQLPTVPLLLVLTSRPEFQSQWSGHACFTTLDLGRLTPVQSGALVSRLSNGKALPEDLAGRIVSRTDGIPLFVEEMTRAILESGDLVEEDDRYIYKGTSASVSIPETLRDSLTARLDRVPAVRRIAQVGAAIGREFSYEQIAGLELMPEPELRRALGQLTDSELAFQRGAIPGAVYTFKHALVQDVAYDSMLKSQRQPLHATIARVLRERWPEIAENEPELLAHHYTAAALTETAVPLWRHAGEVAMQRFALPEALTHLRMGMALVNTIPESPARDLMELGLRTVMGPAIVAQRGWGHTEVTDVLEPAWDLAERLEQRAGYVPILNALWVNNLCRDQLAVSLQWADKLRLTGAAAHDDSLEIVGQRAASASHYWLGNFALARKHGDIVQSIYHPQRHWHIAQLTNWDPWTGEGIYRGQYLWMMGYPDQARTASDQKDEHARRRNHPFDLAFSLTLGAQIFDHLSEPEQLLRRTEEAERVGREHGVALLWEVMAEISRGIAWLRGGRVEESVRHLEKAIARLITVGNRIWVWYLKALQAEGLALAGDLPAAAALLEESVDRMQQGEERAHYAEILRIRGWLLIQQGKLTEAEASLRASIDVAHGQQAKSWELRSASTLAQLFADTGQTRQARELLAPVYGWFTEGFGTKDLREARALLDSLHSTNA